MNGSPSWKPSKRSQQDSASGCLFITFFAYVVPLYSSPGIFFFSSPNKKIQSEKVLEPNIRSFVWRLVEEKKDDKCVCVCTCVRGGIVYTVALC